MKRFYYVSCTNVDVLSDICALRFKHEKGHYPRPGKERNTRNFYKITLINKGDAILYCNDAQFQLSPGKIYLSHPDDLTSYKITSEYLDIYDVIFKKNILQDICNSSCALFDIFFSDSKSPQESGPSRFINADKEIPKIINLMYLESQRDTMYHSKALKLYLQLLLIKLERIYTITRQASISEEMVLLVDKTIEENFASSFDFQRLAARAGVTREHLGRVYCQATGATISKALKRKRLINAAELLKKSQVSILEVAVRSGFQDLSYFFRSFKAEFNITPRQFRKQNRLG